MSTKVYPILTVEDLDTLPEDGNRYELFEGELFVSSSPGIPHQRILANLLTALKNYLDRNPVGEVFPNPGVIFNKINAAIPDLVFLTNEQLERVGDGPHIHEAPELAVEIVSPGRENARRDREVKRQVYGKFGVKEYWIVDPATRSVEVYRLTRGTLKLAATLKGEDEITSPALPGFGCKVSRVFGK
jgi:Uma2 family endonuclease